MPYRTRHITAIYIFKEGGKGKRVKKKKDPEIEYIINHLSGNCEGKKIKQFRTALEATPSDPTQSPHTWSKSALLTRKDQLSSNP